jgi:hypothetical protein
MLTALDREMVPAIDGCTRCADDPTNLRCMEIASKGAGVFRRGSWHKGMSTEQVAVVDEARAMLGRAARLERKYGLKPRYV